MSEHVQINKADIEPDQETKTWLYDIMTHRGGEKVFSFVKNLDVEELYQLHCLLQLQCEDLA